MIWGNKDKVYILGIAVIVIIFMLRGWLRKRRIKNEFADTEQAGFLLKEYRPGRDLFKQSLLITSLLLCLIAYLRPRYGVHAEMVKRRGVNLIFAIDTSKSMWTGDIPPNRFEKAKHEIKTLVKYLEGNRMGLITFSGKAFLKCPLTTDAAALTLILESIEPGDIPVPGTSIRSAIEKSIEAFKRARADKLPVLILLTDGEETLENIESVKSKLEELNIKFFVIGVGTESGAPIPDLRNKKGYVKDKQGNIVVSRLNISGLESMARAANGTAYTTTIGEEEARMISKEISKMEKEEISSRRWVLYDEKYQIFVIIAIFGLALEVILTNREQISS